MKKATVFLLIISLILSVSLFVLAISADNVEEFRGDADGNGSVDSRDVVLIRQYLANLNYSTGESSVEINDSADMNGNGKIDLSDCILLREYIANMTMNQKRRQRKLSRAISGRKNMSATWMGIGRFAQFAEKARFTRSIQREVTDIAPFVSLT